MISIVDVLMPSSVLLVFALATIPLAQLAQRKRRHRVFSVTWVVLGFTLAFIAFTRLAVMYHGQPQPFLQVSLSEIPNPQSTTFLLDAVSIYMGFVTLAMGFISNLYGVLSTNESGNPGRYSALTLIIVGAILAGVLSGDLLTLFIFWESAAAAACFLIVYRRTAGSLAAGVKYLVMFILASGLIVYGLSMIYGLTGSLNYQAIRNSLTAFEDKTALVLAFVLMVSGYAVEAAVVPFHMWLPPSYTAAPSASSALLSAVMDQGSLYVLIRVLLYILTPPLVVDWPYAMSVFAGLTMTVGNLSALAQKSVKRLICYVCIADVGYNLVALSSVTPLGVMGNLFFFLVGGMTTALSFMCVGIFNKMGLRTLKDLTGIGRRAEKTSFALAVAALSFPGIPGLAGFMAKYMIFTAAVEANMPALAVVGVLNSVVELAYFVRLLRYMYAKPVGETMKLKEPKMLLVPIYILVAAIIFLGIYPTALLQLITPVLDQLRPMVLWSREASIGMGLWV